MFLIYPYWNINLTTALIDVLLTAFLIYPYWNINTFFQSVILLS